MDALNAGLYAMLTGDGQLAAACPGGSWDSEADDGTPLPLNKFQLIIETPDHVFGGTSCDRYVYKITGHAEDTIAKTAKELVAVIKGHLKRVINNNTLTVTGYEVLLCHVIAGIPPQKESRPKSPTTYNEGVLAEIFLAPA